jgi:alpha-tubulin suppressor-like RCC1 family protein
VPGITGATQIASHGFAVQTCALDGEGAITCWGSYGVQRAGGTTRLGEEHETLPRIADERVRQIGVGPWEVCAVTESGKVYCHRQSLASARGDDVAVYAEATRVEGIEEATEVAVGVMHACALLADGDVACWGENTHGQLGDGTREVRDHPVLATALADEPASSGGEGS